MVLRWPIAFLILFSVLGCEKGPEVAPVTGVVTHDGVPLADAEIEFQPDYGAPSYAHSDGQGQYEVSYQLNKKGALLGHHFVSIRTAGEKTDPKTDTTVNVPELVPAEYNDDTTLEFEVKKGKNVFDIEIVGKRKRRRRREE